MAIVKLKKKRTSVGNVVEKLDFSYIANGYVKSSHYEKQLGGSSES